MNHYSNNGKKYPYHFNNDDGEDSHEHLKDQNQIHTDQYAFYIADIENQKYGVYIANTLPDAIVLMLYDYDDYEENQKMIITGFKLGLGSNNVGITKIDNVECYFKTD